MSKGKVKKAKDKFDALPEGFKEAILQSSVSEIEKRMSQIAQLDIGMRETLKKDGDVENAKAVLKNLMQPYRDDFKSFKLQMEFAKWTIDQKDGGASAAKAEESRA